MSESSIAPAGLPWELAANYEIKQLREEVARLRADLAQAERELEVLGVTIDVEPRRHAFMPYRRKFGLDVCGYWIDDETRCLRFEGHSCHRTSAVILATLSSGRAADTGRREG